MLYFIIPTYNEELNIEELSKSLKKVLPDYKKFFVFIDDHSTDGTINKIKSNFELRAGSLL